VSCWHFTRRKTPQNGRWTCRLAQSTESPSTNTPIRINPKPLSNPKHISLSVLCALFCWDLMLRSISGEPAGDGVARGGASTPCVRDMCDDGHRDVQWTTCQQDASSMLLFKKMPSKTTGRDLENLVRSPTWQGFFYWE
jgi:hypothetical protein